MATDQTSMLADEEKPFVPEPVEFSSRRHVSLTVTAVEDRASLIESLAKKTRDEGYHRISRELQADADMLREEVLPAIREQQELPLAGPDEARSAIANYMRISVRAAIAHKENDEAMLDRLANRLVPLLEKVYEIGFAVGVTSRVDEPDYAIVRACFKAANEAAR